LWAKAGFVLGTHFVGTREQRRRYGEAERGSRFEIDHQLEHGRALNGKVGGPDAFQDAVYVMGEPPIGFR
jgi:hypothetical protein